MSIEMEQEVEKWEQKKVFFWSRAIKMKIAICVIDKAFAAKLKTMLYHYAALHKLDVVVDCYQYGEAMLSSGIVYSIVFLDYKLAGENGLKIAEKLRSCNDFSALIFISTYTQFVFEAFKVKPYRFLVPPFEEEKFYAVLDEFFEEYSKNCPLWVKCGEDTVCLNIGEIVYLEADNKRCIIHLPDSQYHCNRTMARVSSVLPQNCFGKINRAFIVNFNHIQKYNNDFVGLTGGYNLHISRNYLKLFKEEYRNFINPKEP